MNKFTIYERGYCDWVLMIWGSKYSFMSLEDAVKWAIAMIYPQ